MRMPRLNGKIPDAPEEPNGDNAHDAWIHAWFRRIDRRQDVFDTRLWGLALAITAGFSGLAAAVISKG